MMMSQDFFPTDLGASSWSRFHSSTMINMSTERDGGEESANALYNVIMLLMVCRGRDGVELG